MKIFMLNPVYQNKTRTNRTNTAQRNVNFTRAEIPKPNKLEEDLNKIIASYKDRREFVKNNKHLSDTLKKAIIENIDNEEKQTLNPYKK